MPFLAEEIQKRFPDPIAIVVGGAFEHGSPLPWDLESKHCRFTPYRFEPNAGAMRGDGFYPFALWDHNETITLRVNKLPAATSYYAHNLPLLHRFAGFPHVDEPTSIIEVPAIRGDEWMRRYQIQDIDFMYLNIEGAELKALQGFGDELSRLVGIHLELTMIDNFWVGAPCFSDIDPLLRKAGFMFVTFTEFYQVGRLKAPFRWPPKGHQFQVKALYLRDPVRQYLDRGKLLKLVCMADLYGQVEIAAEAASLYGPGIADILAGAEAAYLSPG
jgi:FkbM family methyltransferase